MAFRSRPPVLVFLSLFIFVAVLVTCILVLRDNYKPVHPIQTRSIPVFTDDMEITSLIECATIQAAYLKRQDPDKIIFFGSDSFTNQWLFLSIQELLTKLKKSPGRDELNRFLREKYELYQAGGRKSGGGRRMLVTGYYEPLFEGSLTRYPPYLSPIYSPPVSLVVLSADKNHKGQIGRYEGANNFVDYWSRAEIEGQNLLKGYEIAYLKDPVDAFLLHVQGSGRIRLPDNSIRSVRFAGSNGLEYNSIGKLLVDENIMSLEEVSIPAIRRYLQRHPEEQQRILHHNPRFIFFNWGDNLGPRGSSGERLTPGRSIAIDWSALPGGTIGYLISRRPVVDDDGNITAWKPISRFVFPQDSGAAIKGTGRVDIFWGNGRYAELAANHMKEEGELYFLVKKGYPGSK
jgi:membrane-bound lytic murein transglycosylase A